MLKFYHGTNLEKLAGQLLRELENPRENLLAPEIFVVQNHGVGQWLSLYLAEQEGIAANFKFEFPSERIWSLIRLIDPDIPQTLPSDRGPMIWSLMSLLQEENVLSDFENLQHYVQDGGSGQRVVRMWKLSSKIADVFDQYLVYRPELITGWEQGILRYNNDAERWQSKLWCLLIDHWRPNHNADWLHRAQLQKQLLGHIRRGTLDREQLPERVTVFGVSALPPVFLEIMSGLSELIDIHFYQLIVDPDIKDAASFENPLLQSLGKQGAAFMSLFDQQAKADYLPADRQPQPKETLFHEIQEDLRQDTVSPKNVEAPISDGSIQVHSCHSPMREVEVLYDQLLAALDEDPELHPDDILIMTPEIETYAPVIEAVFGTPDAGQPDIPYSIADRGIQSGHPVVQTFLKILELGESRFKVTDVLDLLDSAPIQEAFSFSDDDLNRIEMWIKDNRIRWGIDAAFKKEMDVPESESFTWRSGLNRMLLGYAMKQDGDQLYNGIFPYHEIETSADAELAGKLSHFLHALFEITETVKNSKTPEQWKEALTELTRPFLPDTREYFRDVSRIRNSLDQLKESASTRNYSGAIPFRIIRFWLDDQLSKQATGGGQMGRGVTFSSLMPMRSIPFKMTGMIGMNEGAFPRSKMPIEFDLMHLKPEPGDPSQSDEDRFLFLENLLSARSHIYFSYVGQSNRQDTEFPPSVVLKEFLDYLEEYYGLESKKLVTKHRLQAFSPVYFRDGKLFSYSQTQQNIAKQLLNGANTSASFLKKKLPEPPEDWKQLSINDLVSFYQHPAKYLLRNRLGIYLGEDEMPAEDREPFVLEKLDKYHVKQDLLAHFLQDESLEDLEQVLWSRDILPEGWAGSQAYQQKKKAVEDFGSKIKAKLNQQQLGDCEVDLDIGEFRVVGKLTDLYEQSMITYRFGKKRPKDLVNLWIRHLILQLVKPKNHCGNSSLFTWDDAFEQTKLSPAENAQAILNDLLTYYWEGLQKPGQFYPRSSHCFVESVIQKNKKERKALGYAQKEWEPSYNGPPGEGEDAYNQLVVGQQNPIEHPEFAEVSLWFWAPFFKALTRISQKDH